MGVCTPDDNDHTSDKGRPRLAELIPSVIGLTGDDPHIDALITLRCTTIALPVTKERTQAVVDATTRGWPGVNDAQWGLLRHSASKGLGVQSPWLHAVMSRDTVSRCLGTSLHFWGCPASRLVMVAPSSPLSRPGPCGWPSASLDLGCGRHVWAGIGMPGGVWLRSVWVGRVAARGAGSPGWGPRSVRGSAHRCGDR